MPWGKERNKFSAPLAASLLAAPIHAATTWAMLGLGKCESPYRFIPGPVQLEAASVRLALTHDVLDIIADEHAALRDSDAAMLRPRTPERVVDGVLQPDVRPLCSRHRSGTTPQGLLVRSWLAERACPALELWFTRRLAVLERRIVKDDVCIARLRLTHALRTLPAFVALALVSAIAKA